MLRSWTLLLLLLLLGNGAHAENEETTTEEGSREDKVMKMPSRVGGPHPGGKDRGEVSETDVYLLSAIEKLAYRVDFIEKRLRRTEDLIMHVMASYQQPGEKADPCPGNFTRAAGGCYHFSSSEKGARMLDWQAASAACKATGGALVELESVEETQDVVAYIKATASLRDKSYWTGGLNPGLLWIWSDSGRPVSTSKKPTKPSQQQNIRGSGRCLLLGYDAALRGYSLVGADCSRRQHYVCEAPDNGASNALERIQRNLRFMTSGNSTIVP
ncbi:hypothetical protein B566_EDAN000724 [Ephemera danica]|nr:hypothetical protein B566_EDAN000724 [Ephemera danica]